MCKLILQFTEEVTFCLKSHASLTTLQGSKQNNESQRVLGLDCGQDEEEFPKRSAAAIAVKGWLYEGSHYRAEAQKPFSKAFATNCISEAVKRVALLDTIDTQTLCQNV
ncbi:hypothetical protein ElyMa_002037100 [Elysia marginata]|uniref:Uncharacterized protein n=1 Tax=Elysia marginata TaxID=1093978 RepID=A0AAV4F7F1_9GAST|nr:hypothetical protein ElyMa_002037100 [Elysia marginata]